MPRSSTYTAEEVADALRKTAGIKAAAARRLDCHYNTIDNYIKRYPTVAAAYEEARKGIVDMAESIMVERLNAHDWDAAKWVLSTLGKDRGYTTRSEQEHSGKDGGPLVVKVEYGNGRQGADNTDA